MATRPRRGGTYNVDLLRDDLALKGWLPKDLAAAAGVSEMTISRFLNETAQTAPTAKKIATALGRSIRRYYIPRETAVAS